MLDLINVNKTYTLNKRENCVAIKGVNLSLPSCGMVFILGKSGSGKSTLLNLIGGLDNLTGGDILIQNKSIRDFTDKELNAYRNTVVGFVFQECNMMEEFSVFDNVLLSLNLQNKEEDFKKVDLILEKLDILDIKDRKPSEISGGQKQRVAIARAIVKDPKIVLCDEPTGNLDSKLGKDIFKTLKKLSKDRLVLVVSHDNFAANKYADRIIELNDGKVVSDRACKKTDNEIVFDGKNVFIPKQKVLTSKELKTVNSYIKENNATILFKKQIKKKKEENKNTTGNLELKQYKMSKKCVFKMATSNFRIKPLRFIFTMFLMIISLSLLGLGQVFKSYNIIESSVKTFLNNNITNIVLKQGEYSSTFNSFNNNAEKPIGKQSIMAIESAYSGEIDYLYSSSFQFGKLSSEDILSTILSVMGKDIISPYISKTNGVLVTSKQALNKYFKNVEILGVYPEENSNSIAITDYMADCLLRLRVIDDTNLDGIVNYNDILGHKIEDVLGFKLSVSGIIKTGYLEKYNEIITSYNTQPNNFTNHKDYDSFLSSVENYYSVLYTSNPDFIRDVLVEELNYCGIENYKIKQLSGEYLSTNLIDNALSSVGYVFDAEGFYSLFNLNGKTDVEKQVIIENLFSNNSFSLLEQYSNGVIISLDDFNNIFNLQYSTINDFNFNAFNENDLRIKIGEFTPLDSTNNPYNEIDAIVVGVYDFSNDKLAGVNVNGEIVNTVLKAISSNHFISQYNQIKFSKTGMYVSLPSNYNDAYKLIKAANNNYMYHETEMSNNLYLVSNIFEIFSMVIKWVALILAIFSVILLVNFVSRSIMQRQKEIGLFRAIGAGSVDIAKVFLLEVCIMMIGVIVVSILFVYLGTTLLNSLLVSGFVGYLKSQSIIKISLLGLGVNPIIVLIVSGVLISFIGVLLPLIRISKMKPIDIMKRR